MANVSGDWVAYKTSMNNGRTWEKAGMFDKMKLSFSNGRVSVSQFGMNFRPVDYQDLGASVAIPELLITATPQSNGDLLANVVAEQSGNSMLYMMRRA